MRSDTQTVTIDAPLDDVFAFISELENLPKWATGFCRSIRREGDRWTATTSQGEVAVEVVSDAKLGVVDFHISPAPDVRIVAASRVIPNDRGSEYIFTQLQQPGMSDAIFEQQRHALDEELVLLKQILEAKTR